MSEVEGRPVAVVTGAGRKEGIGFEICRQLAARGFKVFLTSRQDETARDRALELAQTGDLVEAASLDVTDAASVDAFTTLIGRRAGRLDVLINNASGAADFAGVAKANLRDAQAIMETTLFGSWRVTQALLPMLMKSPHPRIVNVSSGAGSHGDSVFGLSSQNAMGPAYAVSKAALNALTAALARELRGTPVLVNAVCPGLTATFPGAEAMGARPVPDGAAGIVWAATLDDNGPTGGFFRDGVAMPW